MHFISLLSINTQGREIFFLDPSIIFVLELSRSPNIRSTNYHGKLSKLSILQSPHSLIFLIFRDIFTAITMIPEVELEEKTTLKSINTTVRQSKTEFFHRKLPSAFTFLSRPKMRCGGKKPIFTASQMSCVLQLLIFFFFAQS